MARKFQQIIQKKKLDTFKFIPIQRIEYHALKEIRNIRNEDILPILNIMKETNLLKDLIEINPTLYIIIFLISYP